MHGLVGRRLLRASRPQTTQRAQTSGYGRVLRGGSWGSWPSDSRSASRDWDWPNDRFDFTGFRVARTQSYYGIWPCYLFSLLPPARAPCAHGRRRTNFFIAHFPPFEQSARSSIPPRPLSPAVVNSGPSNLSQPSFKDSRETNCHDLIQWAGRVLAFISSTKGYANAKTAIMLLLLTITVSPLSHLARRRTHRRVHARCPHPVSGRLDHGRQSRAHADPNHILGHGYVFIIAAKYGAAFPDLKLDFLNRGVSGNTVLDLEKRWQKDTLDLKPDVLSILIGVNDSGRGVPLDQYEQVYDKLITQAKAANPKLKLVLCAPFVKPTARSTKTSASGKRSSPGSRRSMARRWCSFSLSSTRRRNVPRPTTGFGTACIRPIAATNSWPTNGSAWSVTSGNRRRPAVA